MTPNEELVNTDGEIIAELSARAAVKVISDCEVKFAVIPEGSKVENLSGLQFPDGRRPSRITANPQMKDAASFVAYFQSYADDRSRVFADPQRASFNGLIDYHGAGEPRAVEFVSHRVGFTMQYDDRWKIWLEKNEKSFTQSEFAEFIEDNRRDIVRPDSATMLEIARNLEAKIEVNFGSSTNLRNGQVQLRYEETVKAGVPTAGNIEVPESFDLSIPVFFGEDPITIEARLRFRITNGKLTFHYKLYRPVETVQTAFNSTVKRISDLIQKTVLIGSLA